MHPLYTNYISIEKEMYSYVKAEAKQYFDTYCNIMIEVFAGYPHILKMVIPKDYTMYEYDSYDNKRIYFRKYTKTGKLSMSKYAERFDLPLNTLFENYPEELRLVSKRVLDEYNIALESPKE